MCKNIGKNISKNFCGKNNHRLLGHTKQSGTDTLEAVPKNQFKTTETTGDLICNKTADKITSASKTVPHNSLEAVKDDLD